MFKIFTTQTTEKLLVMLFQLSCSTVHSLQTYGNTRSCCNEYNFRSCVLWISSHKRHTWTKYLRCV